MRYSPLLLCALAATHISADDLSDFSNDLATDVGPLLVLFGEAMTRQYLSESTSFIDYFIFAMAPIGIITAIVSAIRVCGHSTLRAFIGRSQEGDGVVEAELCTSTSRDVCELFNKGGITRVLGRPCILELIHIPSQQPGKQDELHLFRHYLENNQDPNTTEWIKIQHPLPRSRVSLDNKIHHITPFAPKPNLSLNVGIQKRPRWTFIFIAVVGLFLQAGLLALAGVGVWILEWNLSQSGSSASTNYAPIMFITGTIFMCGGMWSCAALIGQTTQEVRYYRKDGTSRSCLLWLQPGPQVIGDQNFDAFAHFDQEPLKVWTSSKKDFDERFELYTFFAVAAVLLGYISQFIGLRGMKAWVSLAQLGITVIMSILRGLLRVQRLGRDANKLRKMPDLISGHELDWLAFQLTLGSFHGKTFWCTTGQSNQAVVNKDDSREDDQDKSPLEFDKVLNIRQRLAHLTGHSPSGTMVSNEFQQWEHTQVNLREHSQRLSIAICEAAESLIQKKAIKDQIVIQLQIAASTGHMGESNKGTIDISMKPPTGAQTKWAIDSSQLEAVLGLSMWSLVSAKCLQGRDETGHITSNFEDVKWKRIVSCSPHSRDKHPQFDGRPNDLKLWFGPDAGMLACDQTEVDKSDVRGLIDFQTDSHASHWHRYCGWNIVHKALRSQATDQSNIDMENHSPSALTKIQVQSAPAEDSFAAVLAQDLFLAIFSPLVDILITGKAVIGESGGHVLLQNSTVTTLSDILVDSGLSSRLGALSCAVSLLGPKLHPDPESLLSGLIEAANAYRRNLEWERAETLLQWGCNRYQPLDSGERPPLGGTLDLFIKVLRTTGELYRWSCAERSNEERKQFGVSGIKWLHDNFDQFSSRYPEVSEILGDYQSIGESISLQHPREAFLPNPPKNYGSGGQHPLVRAIQDRDRKMSLWLLLFTNTGDFDRHELHPSLPLAARNGWTEVVDAILEMKGDINSQDEDGRSSMSHCAEHGHLSLLQQFIGLGASFSDSDNEGRSPILWAIQKKEKNAAEALLQAGFVGYDALYNKDISPMVWAMKNGLVEIMHLLVDQQARIGPDRRLSDHELILDAAKTGNQDVLKSLVERNISIESRDSEDFSPLGIAAREGNMAAMTLLLDCGAQMEAVDEIGRTPLLRAIEDGDLDATRLLLTHTDAPTAHSRVWTSLLFAVLKGHWTCVQSLLQKRAVSNSISVEDPATPLLSTTTPQKAVLDNLLELDHNSDVGSQSEFLMQSFGELGSVVKLLVSQGASLDAKTGWEYSPLHIAVDHGSPEAVMALLDSGADLEERDHFDGTALSNACRSGHEEIVKILLEWNADVGSVAYYYESIENEAVRQLLLEKAPDRETKEAMRRQWGVDASESKPSWISYG